MTPQSPELPLADQLVVFTGKLSSLGRKEAQALVIRLGGSAADEVTSRTTLVVVGAEGEFADRGAIRLQQGARTRSPDELSRTDPGRPLRSPRAGLMCLAHRPTTFKGPDEPLHFG